MVEKSSRAEVPWPAKEGCCPDHTTADASPSLQPRPATPVAVDGDHEGWRVSRIRVRAVVQKQVRQGGTAFLHGQCHRRLVRDIVARLGPVEVNARVFKQDPCLDLVAVLQRLAHRRRAVAILHIYGQQREPRPHVLSREHQ
ncbi:hypothetical protein PG984_007126 [Apiospora sp. TS-2023a]